MIHIYIHIYTHMYVYSCIHSFSDSSLIEVMTEYEESSLCYTVSPPDSLFYIKQYVYVNS